MTANAEVAKLKRHIFSSKAMIMEEDVPV